MREKAILLIVIISLTILTMGIVPEVNALVPIYIRANGSIEGTSQIVTSDDVTYTFTGNIQNSLVVEKDGIVLDGAGFSLSGSGAPTGIELKNRNNITIKNIEVTAFQNGFAIWYSQGITISASTIKNCNPNAGIYSYSTTNSIITGNTIQNNTGNGIHLSSSSNGNTITQNNINNNNAGIYLLGDSSNCLISNNILTENRGDGIRDSGLGHNTITENQIKNNKAYGIRFSSSSNNEVENNVVENNLSVGIGFWSASSYNAVSGNNVNHNRIGVYMYTSNNNYNNITSNNIEDNSENGIQLDHDNDFNRIVGNEINSNGKYGVELDYSSDTTLTENNIVNSGGYGMRLFDTSNSLVYNNSFDNAKQVLIQGSQSQSNRWDNGTRGNFWSDYLTRYPNAHGVEDTGIWDAPYVIDDSNQDNYPLMGNLNPLATSTQTPASSSTPAQTLMPSGTPSETPGEASKTKSTYPLPIELIFAIIVIVAASAVAALIVWKKKKTKHNKPRQHDASFS